VKIVNRKNGATFDTDRRDPRIAEQQEALAEYRRLLKEEREITAIRSRSNLPSADPGRHSKGGRHRDRDGRSGGGGGGAHRA